MGATKRGAELVVRSLAQTSQTCFLIVRFGNVLGSNGSVVPRFQKQIRAGGPVTVTHPDVRRYFMSIPEAVELVLQTSTLDEQGALYVLDMGRQIKLLDLARHLIRLSGFLPEKEIPIQFVGLRPGEKLEEELVGTGETTERSPIDKIFQIKSETSRDFRLLNQVLETFKNGSFSNSSSFVIQQLQQLVPTFSHSENGRVVENLEPYIENVHEDSKTILVVDDDEPGRRAIRALLENEGYTCLEAEHGGKALDLLGQTQVDLVITDNRMPVLTGLEFLERLSKSAPSNLLPVVVFSGNLGQRDKERAFKAGACAILDKPHDVVKLMPKINQIFTQQSTSSRERMMPHVN